MKKNVPQFPGIGPLLILLTEPVSGNYIGSANITCAALNAP
jgi:hypothetical protein